MAEVAELKLQVQRLKDAVEIAREERDSADSRAMAKVQSEMAALRALAGPTYEPGERALCVCQGGLVRSAACVYVLRYEFKINAIAVGVDHQKTSADWRRLLHWATVVFTVSEDVERQMLEQWGQWGLSHKNHIPLNIGEDRWGMKIGPYNSSLLELAFAEISASGFQPRN